jgi:enoyl-CoA hydratase
MVEVDRHGEIALLHMAHGKANALDIEFCDSLSRTFDELRNTPDVRGVVLTARGTIFSAGVDLPRIVSGGAEYVRAFLPAMDRSFRSLFLFPKPLVIAVNGHAIAGGALLTWCGDHRAMAAGAARIGVPELAVGVPFPPSALEIVRWVMPAQHLQETLYSGVTYTPEDALRLGMIDVTVDGAALVEHALERARAMAAFAPRSFAATKTHARDIVRDRLDGAGTKARETLVTELWCDPETQAAIRTYVEAILRK